MNTFELYLSLKYKDEDYSMNRFRVVIEPMTSKKREFKKTLSTTSFLETLVSND